MLERLLRDLSCSGCFWGAGKCQESEAFSELKSTQDNFTPKYSTGQYLSAVRYFFHGSFANFKASCRLTSGQSRKKLQGNLVSQSATRSHWQVPLLLAASKFCKGSNFGRIVRALGTSSVLVLQACESFETALMRVYDTPQKGHVVIYGHSIYHASSLSVQLVVQS